MNLSHPALRIHALGALAALALTLGAGVVAIGPHIIARGPSPADQQAELERRRREAAALDKQTDSTRQRLVELAALDKTAVHLQPAARVNERLVEITKLAAGFAGGPGSAITLAQMTPGTPAPPAQSATPADKAVPPAAAAALDSKTLIVPIKLAGSGSYPDVARFIHALREQFRDTAITALRINAQPAAPSVATPYLLAIRLCFEHAQDN